MSSKSSTTSSADAVREAIASSSTAPEMARQQFARAADMAAAAFRAIGEVQKVNLQMGERAALLLSQAGDNARKASSPMELAQIQSQLVMYEWQEFTRYSQELMVAFTRVTAHPPGAAEQAAASTASSSKAPNGLADAMGAAAPMVQAWQQVFSGMVPEMAQAKH